MSAYYDLGTYSRPVATRSPEAQLWFDRGLVWVYGFNHEEAIRCFRRALAHDPRCAMAWWGLAYAYGPYINKEWHFYSDGELAEMLPLMRQAQAEAAAWVEPEATVERALIEALAVRVQAGEKRPLIQMNAWLDNYATAMAAVYAAHPNDRDVIALYAEAMMMRTPWKLWDLPTGQPAEGADTVEITAVLTHALHLTQHHSLHPHPGILHMFIHTLEMSPHPERALPAANQLRDLAPDAGHLNHMPCHIDVLCGHYAEAIIASEKAIAADEKYLAQVGVFDQYTAACCHDCHLLMFAAMLSGREQPARTAAAKIAALATPEVLRAATPAFASTLEAYASMALHVPMRFGRWQEIINAPLPDYPDLYCVTTAMTHYAKAVAHATLGQFGAAETEQKRFEAAVARVPADRYAFNNHFHSVLAVARAMMHGEMGYHQGKYEAAFAQLRQAVVLNDGLNYTEPWAWMHPPRHALGALLLAQGRVAEAMAVYEADLGVAGNTIRAMQYPNNVWSLHGYVECLQKLGQVAGLAEWEGRLQTAVSHTDTPIHASCACRTESYCCY